MFTGSESQNDIVVFPDSVGLIKTVTPMFFDRMYM